MLYTEDESPGGNEEENIAEEIFKNESKVKENDKRLRKKIKVVAGFHFKF